MNTEIRKIIESDFEELLNLFKEFALFEKVPEKMQNTLERMRHDKDFLTGFVIVSDKEIIGYVTFFFAYYTWYGKSLYMDDLYVRKEYRGKGFGSLLTNRVIEYAKEHQCKKLRWQVSSWNTQAIRFYKQLGATIDDVENNCDLML